MALYVIADLHLSLGADKPMDVFGGRWEGYMDKLRAGLAVIGPEDTTVLPGDLSWALGIEQAKEDFAFISAIPGRKILLKGNHDYWWTTAAKFYKFCAEQGFSDMEILHNNCHFYGDIALCGTRGWFYEEDKGGTHDEKVFRRELGRLETSLKAAGQAGEALLSALSAALSGLRVPGDSGAAGALWRAPLLLRPSPRREPPAGLAGKLARDLNSNWFSADYVNFKPVKILD